MRLYRVAMIGTLARRPRSSVAVLTAVASAALLAGCAGGGGGGTAAACTQATLTLPQAGQATITFTTVQIRDLGDDAAALQMTTSLTKADGTKASVPALLGAVEDSDRLLLLITAGTNGAAPDQAA